MKTPTKIPHDSDFFISNGTKYFFNLDAIANDRIVEFLELSPQINLGMNVASFHKILTDTLSKLTPLTLETTIEQVIEARGVLFDAIKVIEETSTDKLSQAQVDKVWRFCTLFINREGEDTTKVDPAVMNAKISDWKKDMDFNSFFLLQRHVSKSFPLQLDLTSFQIIMEQR